MADWMYKLEKPLFCWEFLGLLFMFGSGWSICYIKIYRELYISEIIDWFFAYPLWWNNTHLFPIASNRVHRRKNGSKPRTSTTVAYYYCNDPIPYRTTLPGDKITLAQFKTLISKKGDYRWVQVGRNRWIYEKIDEVGDWSIFLFPCLCTRIYLWLCIVRSIFLIFWPNQDLIVLGDRSFCVVISQDFSWFQDFYKSPFALRIFFKEEK